MNMTERDLQHGSKDKIKALTELDLYGMTKQALIKKLQTLVHELKVYYQLEATNVGQEYFKVKEYSELLVTLNSYKHNQSVLADEVKASHSKVTNLEEQLRQKDKDIARLQKQAEIYKKKIAQFERIGGKTRLLRLEQCNNQQNSRIQSLATQNKQIRKTLLLAQKKCKILEELNSQTEMELADLLVTQVKARKDNEGLEEEIMGLADSREKENSINRSNLHVGKETNKDAEKEKNIEILALKEKIRELQLKLKASQESKEHLRLRQQERQLFYSKMMASRI